MMSGYTICYKNIMLFLHNILHVIIIYFSKIHKGTKLKILQVIKNHCPPFVPLKTLLLCYALFSIYSIIITQETAYLQTNKKKYKGSKK